jgi:hypothetical protein
VIRGFDAISAQAVEAPVRKLIIGSGLHGVEGFIGAAVVDLFVSEVMSSLDAANTGLLLIHPINSTGMAARRRSNLANVDLNRNFIESLDQFSELENPEYARIYKLLNPHAKLRSRFIANMRLLAGLIGSVMIFGLAQLRKAVTFGQYRFPLGFYYGGRQFQPETSRLRKLVQAEKQAHKDVIMLDIHSGYGPRRQMTLVNLPLEEESPVALQAKCHYPHITEIGSQSFFEIKGDMLDYFIWRSVMTVDRFMARHSNSVRWAIRSSPRCEAYGRLCLKTSFTIMAALIRRYPIGLCVSSRNFLPRQIGIGGKKLSSMHALHYRESSLGADTSPSLQRTDCRLLSL